MTFPLYISPKVLVRVVGEYIKFDTRTEFANVCLDTIEALPRTD
jgi:hypothetical protein